MQALIFNISIAIGRVRHVMSAPWKAAECFTQLIYVTMHRAEDGMKCALAG